MDMSDLEFPKPGDINRFLQPVSIFRDGREVCNKAVKQGREEYRRRTLAMLERQEGRCCLQGHCPMCPGALLPSEATFEHEFGRGHGGGKRDDRIILPDGTWINGASHDLCNRWKGSRHIPYNQTFQFRGDDGPPRAF